MVTDKAPHKMFMRWFDDYVRGFGMRVRQSDSEIEYIRADLHQAEVDALHAECDRLTALVGGNRFCLWHQVDSSDMWWTECDKAAFFVDEGPVENGFKYCPYCGGEIRIGEGE
jgi:hypothetical protein